MADHPISANLGKSARKICSSESQGSVLAGARGTMQRRAQSLSIVDADGNYDRFLDEHHFVYVRGSLLRRSARGLRPQPPGAYDVPGVLPMFKHILVPTDGSPASTKAARAAVRLAAEVGARVTAYHAIDTSQPYLFGDGYAADARTFVDFARLARENGERQVDAVGKLAKAARVPFTPLVAKARTPYEGIVSAARKNKCDLIFIASHGRRGLSKLMMGSVTQKVLARATVPVMVYR